tara:strand:- start:25 stop:690 length:666 start_codon:yes stop_codon:yes gene_type:complete
MIIDKEKLIFVHIPKNAGTSIKAFFGAVEDNVVKEFHKHRTIKEIKNENPEAYNSYKKFAIVRNPYERMVSWYAYINSYLLHNDLLNVYDYNSNIVETKKPEISGFKKFIKNPEIETWEYNFNHTYLKANIPGYTIPQPKVSSSRLKLLKPQCYWVDETVKILRYENLKEELENFLGIKINLDKLNKSSRDDILAYYDKDSLDIVYEKYKEDFKKFNYKKL